jgi:hypothetical protein
MQRPNVNFNEPVMIKVADTFVTRPAVFSVIGNPHLAVKALVVFDHMLAYTPIQGPGLHHGWCQANAGFCGI